MIGMTVRHWLRPRDCRMTVPDGDRDQLLRAVDWCEFTNSLKASNGTEEIVVVSEDGVEGVGEYLQKEKRQSDKEGCYTNGLIWSSKCL